MFENVIAGVDGRPTGRDAIELARHLVSPEGRPANWRRDQVPWWEQRRPAGDVQHA
jgi:hypothetical protein